MVEYFGQKLKGLVFTKKMYRHSLTAAYALNLR
ncbi:hypothetical protein [Candidatus Endomicrobiellum trichonymphae]